MNREIILKSTVGLHASLASKIVQTASKYDAHVKLQYGELIVDAKSILGLMSLAIPTGKNVLISATGEEAEKALNDIEKLIG